MKKILSSSFRTALLSAFFLLALFAKVQYASAQVAADAQNDYANYLNLFDDGQSGLSIPSAGDLIQDSTTNAVTGFKVNIDLGFTSNDSDTLKKKWEHVIQTTDQAFVIRACDSANPNNCWINTIPYNTITTTNGSPDLVGTSISPLYQVNTFTKDVYNNPIILSNFSVFSGPTKTGNFNSYRYNYTRDTSGNKDEGTVSAFNGLPLTNVNSVNLTVWYCADSVSNETNGAQAYQKIGNILNDKIATFGTLCKGNSYFRIGDPITITIPATTQGIAAQANTQQTTVSGTTNKDNLPECGVVPGLQNGTINGCAAQLAYGVYWLTAWLAGLFGGLFDFFIGYSLSDASYRFTFAVTGWKLVRDISNVFFIIIMVWTGFSAVFNTSKTSMKSVVPNLIINALLINFSLFATRVVIDISNITARMFYSQMIVCEQVNIDANGNCPPAQAKRSWGGYWPLSEKIIGSFNPQAIFKTSVLQPPSNTGANTTANFNAQNAASASSTNARDYATYFGIVCLIAAFIMVFVTIMFFRVTFLFLGRVIGLYICMIFSPFAFLSRDMPLLSGISTLRWSDWTEELTNYATLGPIFLFFLYIIYIFLSSNFVQQVGFKDPSGSFFGTVLAIVIPMLIIFFLLQAAQKAAEKFSGDIGKRIQQYGERVTGAATGTAFGLATGGAGFLGRNVAGRAMQAYGNSTTGKKVMVDGKEVDETRAMRLAARSATSWSARQQNNFLRWGQTSSWNAGNAGVKVGGKEYTLNTGISKGLGALGVKTNNLAEKLSYVGKDAGKGGILAVDKKRVEDRQKEIENRIKFDHLSDDQAKAVWEQYKQDHINKASATAAEKTWQDHVNEEPAVKSAAENLARIEKENTDLKNERLNLESEETALTKKVAEASTPSEHDRYQNQLTQNKSKQAANRTALAANENNRTTAAAQLDTVRTSTVDDLKKDGKYRQSEAYAKAQEKSTQEEETRLNKYGKIKNGKALTAAMRAEYAEDLRQKSFWLEDGKPRYLPGSLGAATAAALTAVLPGFGALIGLAVLKNMTGGLIDNKFGTIDSKATKKIVDGFKSSQGKGNKEARLSTELDEINNQIKKSVEVHFGSNAPKGDADSWTTDVIEQGLAGHTFVLQKEVNAIRAEIAAAKAAGDEIREREKAVEARVKEKQIEKLNKIIEEKKRVQNELDKVKAANKQAEDNERNKNKES